MKRLAVVVCAALVGCSDDGLVHCDHHTGGGWQAEDECNPLEWMCVGEAGFECAALEGGGGPDCGDDGLMHCTNNFAVGATIRCASRDEVESAPRCGP